MRTENNVPSQSSTAIATPSRAYPAPARECCILEEGHFRQKIAAERKRTERSRQPFLLLLLDAGNGIRPETNGGVLSEVLGPVADHP